MARAPLQWASASTRIRLAVRPEGKHGEEDTKAELTSGANVATIAARNASA